MSSKARPTIIRPAMRYTAPKDLWVVSTYFDSEGYSSKLRALRAYMATMERSGIPLLLVEGAFGKRPFLLPESDRVLHVRCPSILWQKERLLNIAIDHLPPSCMKVAWLDTDVFFENADWAVETASLLDEHPVVQPFDVALWLPKGTTAFRGKGLAWSGFAAASQRHPGLFLSGDFDRHGHSGYAWAARRELIAKHGLYDRSIVGSGDHLMAHVMMGDLWSPCVTNSVGAETAFRASLEDWGRPFHEDVRSDVGFISGALLHRWHGDRKKRRYYKRMVGLLARQYDPSLDVREAPSGALEWTEHGAALGRWMKDYFSGRKEDAKPGPAEKVLPGRIEALRSPEVSDIDQALQSIRPLLGPLATGVSESSEDWEDLGLTPVLPHLFAGLVTGTLPPEAVNPLRLGVGPGTRTRDGDAAGGLLLLPPRESQLRSPAASIAPESVLSDPTIFAQRIVSGTLQRASLVRVAALPVWSASDAGARWALLASPCPPTPPQLVEELTRRVRDPRATEAPELKAAKAQLMRRRAKRGGRQGEPFYPFDTAVGSGATASGLDHV